MPEWEERKYLLAQRRVESIRLLTVLLSQVKDFVQSANQKVGALDFENARNNCFPEAEIKIPQQKTGSDYLLHRGLKHEPPHQVSQMGKIPAGEKLAINLPASPCHFVRTIFNEPATRVVTAITDKDKYCLSSCCPLQITVTQDCKVIKSLDQNDSVARSPKVSGTGCCKKQKVYETDEFIHYLLNYYQTPSYARVCLGPRETVTKSWWQRVVSRNGNGFQISLKNKYGQRFTEVSFVQNLDEGDCRVDDDYRWEITIRESEPVETVSKSQACARGFTKKFQVQWTDSLNEATNKMPHAKRNNNFCEGANAGRDKKSRRDRSKRKVAPLYKPSGSAYKLKDLLEEISSDSEYFSEALGGSQERTKRRSRDCSGGTKASPLAREREKEFLICLKNIAHDDQDEVSNKRSFCPNPTCCDLSKHRRHKLKKTCKRSSSKLRHGVQKSEWPSNEEERDAGRKKKKKKRFSLNVLPAQSSLSEADGCRQLESLKLIERKCSKMFRHKMTFRTLQTTTATLEESVHDQGLCQKEMRGSCC
uniref:A-kinase anchor protein 17B n=1 Tax=Sphenodon punctatus TaxID=8508 RepID=A0A8D0H5N8_SPHPU